MFDSLRKKFISNSPFHYVVPDDRMLYEWIRVEMVIQEGKTCGNKLK